MSYTTAYPATGYGTLAALGGAAPCTPLVTAACLIDDSLATNYNAKGKSGYNFAIATINAGQYAATATPITVGSTERHRSCMRRSGRARQLDCDVDRPSF